MLSQADRPSISGCVTERAADTETKRCVTYVIHFVTAKHKTKKKGTEACRELFGAIAKNFA